MKNIITGLILLDQIVFQQESIKLRVDECDLDTLDLRNHSLCFAIYSGRLTEVVGYSFFERLGFTYIDQFIFLIVITVYPGAIG
jgi:hypothetical protein